MIEGIVSALGVRVRGVLMIAMPSQNIAELGAKAHLLAAAAVPSPFQSSPTSEGAHSRDPMLNVTVNPAHSPHSSCILAIAMKKLLIFLAFVLGIAGIMALILSSSHDFEELDLDSHFADDDL